MRAYFDTSVLVAASVSHHPHHFQSYAATRRVRENKTEGYASGHCLAELYAVLTRTPFAPPVYPSEAWQLINENILPFFNIVSITATMYRQIIQECAKSGWVGGRIYDALHLRCAKEADCQRIYTLNVRHFQQLAPDRKEQVTAP